jgi:hypothetical protein
LEEEASEEVLSERFLAEVAKRPQYGVMPKIRPWEEARFNQAVADRIARVNQKWGFPVRKRSR